MDKIWDSHQQKNNFIKCYNQYLFHPRGLNLRMYSLGSFYALANFNWWVSDNNGTDVHTMFFCVQCACDKCSAPSDDVRTELQTVGWKRQMRVV